MLGNLTVAKHLLILYAAVWAKQGLLFPLQLPVCSFGETCSSCLVQAAHRGAVRSALHNIGVRNGLFGNLLHNRNELVECLFAFGLGRFYHYALVKEQREVDCRCVVAIVEKTLAMSSVVTPVDLSTRPSKTNSCLQTVGIGSL